MNKLTLKKAREEGKLDQFIKEHEKDAPGNSDRLDATIKSAIEPTLPQKKPARKTK